MTEKKHLYRIMCLGDVVGSPGRTALKKLAPELREKHKIDLLVVNGENSSGGVGINPKVAQEIFSCGVDVITLGDHTWRRNEIKQFFEEDNHNCIRPANFPAGAPGKGYTVIESKGRPKTGVMNLMGRVFMNMQLDCPFRAADKILAGPLKDCSVVVCDFHAEATSEKCAMGRHLDGRVTLLFGTHTHVQTADQQILPGGSAYISDLGMCGSADGVIGMDADVALNRFLTGMPSPYKVATGSTLVSGVICDVDNSTGKAVNISLVREFLPDEMSTDVAITGQA